MVEFDLTWWWSHFRNANETRRGFAFQQYISLRQHKGLYLMREQREKLSVIQGHISPFHHYGKKNLWCHFLRWIKTPPPNGTARLHKTNFDNKIFFWIDSELLSNDDSVIWVLVSVFVDQCFLRDIKMFVCRPKRIKRIFFLIYYMSFKEINTTTLKGISKRICIEMWLSLMNSIFNFFKLALLC